MSLRFFDDLPPRAIARRCGVPSAVVRQRVHRGLFMLRARFDAEAGGRADWVRAFGAAGFGAITTSLPVVLPLIAMKKLLVAAVVLLVAGAMWWAGPSTSPAVPTAPEGGPLVASTASSGAGRDAAAPDPASLRTTVNDVFAVRAVDAQDRPVIAASVHRWRAGGEVEVVRTNEHGIATFAPRPEAGGVLVRGRGLQTVVQALPDLRGEVVVRLGVGRVVGGRMFEDGVPVPAGLELKLTVPSKHAELPDAPDAIFDLLTAGRGELTTVTDGRGDFAFAGLADDWAGELQVPRTHWLLRQPGQLVADDDRLLVLAPDNSLRVETTRLSTLRGRVEWSDGSGPVAHAFVMIGRVTFADGATTQTGCQSEVRCRAAVWSRCRGVRARRVPVRVVGGVRRPVRAAEQEPGRRHERLYGFVPEGRGFDSSGGASAHGANQGSCARAAASKSSGRRSSCQRLDGRPMADPTRTPRIVEADFRGTTG